MKQSVKLLAAVVFCLALAAGLMYWKFDWRIVAFFLATNIPYKAIWLPAIGEFGRPLAPLWLFLLWAWAAKRPRLLLAGLLAMLLTLCAVLPIKSAVGRVRPDEEPAEVMTQPFFHRSYSFPSGDATLAFAVATVAAGFIVAAKVRWLPFLLAAMAGVTRLILLRHFASDVIAGAALGILCGCAALRISRGSFVRRALSRVPPTCWRPAFGVAALLYVIFDALKGGPVSKYFLPLFWPAVAFVLIAAKGPAWLRRIGWPWPHWRKDRRMRIGVIIWYFIGLLWCGYSLFVAVGFMRMAAHVMDEKWTWFLPGAAAALLSVCWAASAMWRGSPGRALCRMFAASVLSLGLTWIAIRVAMKAVVGLSSLGR